MKRGTRWGKTAPFLMPIRGRKVAPSSDRFFVAMRSSRIRTDQRCRPYHVEFVTAAVENSVSVEKDGDWYRVIPGN
jgi:DNA-dependent RNA polymerase auxiliary subunit epsilon